MIPLLILGYQGELMDRVNIAFVRPSMHGDFELSAETFGVASGVFFVSYALLQRSPARSSCNRSGRAVCWVLPWSSQAY